MGRTEIQVKNTSSAATVPNDPIAKLMYYLNCISTCVEANDDSTIRRLRDYKNYSSLSSEEEAMLLILCLALSPDTLIGTILFPMEELERFDNEFYEVSAVSTKLVVAESLLIGGQQKRVTKIMMFKKRWLENNYINPLLSIQRGQRPALPSSSSAPQPRQQPAPQPRQQPAPQPRQTPAQHRQRRNSSSCVIL